MAQQQCVGPLQLPVADVAVFAQSHQDISGSAAAIGEAPLKGLIDPAAMARLALGEALTNLCLARGSALQDVRASVNWMYAAKMKAEGVAMYDAAGALRWGQRRAGGGGRRASLAAVGSGASHLQRASPGAQ